MKRPMHMIHIDADRYSALMSRCNLERERAEKAEARIQAAENREALWRVLASPVWVGDESEGYSQCLCCNQKGETDLGTKSIRHTADCEYAKALADAALATEEATP